MPLLQPRLGALAVAALALGLSACTSLADVAGGRYGYPGQGSSARYPDNRYPDGRYEDYRNTREYRSVDRDAARYAERLDRELRLSSSQERAINQSLRSRAYDLLRRTRSDEHRYVYPFPRSESNRYTQQWWDAADRDVERVLDRRQREEYRYLVRGYGSGGRYDRYDDRYRRNEPYYDGRHDNRDRRTDRDRRDDGGDRSRDRDGRIDRDDRRSQGRVRPEREGRVDRSRQSEGEGRIDRDRPSDRERRARSGRSDSGRRGTLNEAIRRRVEEARERSGDDEDDD